MVDPLLDALFKGIQQFGISTVIVVVFLLVFYKLSTKIVLPVAEKLINGHLDFLKDLKIILANQQENIRAAACKSDKLDRIDSVTQDNNKKLDKIYEQVKRV